MAATKENRVYHCALLRGLRVRMGVHDAMAAVGQLQRDRNIRLHGRSQSARGRSERRGRRSEDYHHAAHFRVTLRQSGLSGNFSLS